MTLPLLLVQDLIQLQYRYWFAYDLAKDSFLLLYYLSPLNLVVVYLLDHVATKSRMTYMSMVWAASRVSIFLQSRLSPNKPKLDIFILNLGSKASNLGFSRGILREGSYFLLLGSTTLTFLFLFRKGDLLFHLLNLSWTPSLLLISTTEASLVFTLDINLEKFWITWLFINPIFGLHTLNTYAIREGLDIIFLQSSPFSLNLVT